MTDQDCLNPHPPEFERFLYARVGEDRNGYDVTVLSALARLDLDPWRETTNLVALEQDLRHERLEKLLSVFREVPALGSDAGKVARELCLLLPESPSTRTGMWAGATIANGNSLSTGAIWATFAIVVLLLQVFIFGGSGFSE